MKAKLFTFLIAIIFALKINASTKDSTIMNCNFGKNEIGISIGNMNNLIGSSNDITSSFQVIYKKRFKDFSLRLNFNNKSREKTYNMLQSPVPDSLFNAYVLESYRGQIGIGLGVEKIISFSESLIMFYGIDCNTALLNEKLTKTGSFVNNEPSNSKYKESSNNDVYKNRHGYSLGLCPVIGLSQYFSSNISSSLEFNFLANYSKVETQNAKINLDETIKLSLNFIF